ncbi:MAG TPA: 50S ribosomal protein L3 [Vicinamibacterales bacterium]|nr:50S ribosomal protein L3 [Vicinamibacterales bacterium]
MSDVRTTGVTGILGRKLGMTQVYTDDGALVPVTVIQAGPCTVVGQRTTERDGYLAAQLGFEDAKEARVRKPRQGFFAKAGAGPFRVVREVAVAGEETPSVGTQVRAGDVFVAGDRVAVTGTSKGRGTAGVMKRHNFSGFPASHGTHEYFRHGGSIGNRSYPGRVFKGKRMSGRMGAVRVTTPNLTIVAVRPDDDLLLVRGAVPGARGGLVLVRKLNGGGG